MLTRFLAVAVLASGLCAGSIYRDAPVGGLNTTLIDTSSELAAIITDETGTAGAVVFSDGPTLSNMTTVGGIKCGAVTITNADSPYTIPATVCRVFCDATGGAVTLTASAASNHTGRLVDVKKTDSSSNSCTFDPNGAETVDGAATKTNTTQYQSFSFSSDGTNWFIF